MSIYYYNKLTDSDGTGSAVEAANVKAAAAWTAWAKAEFRAARATRAALAAREAWEAASKELDLAMLVTA